jgi:RHS repeat-associated protein
MKPNQSSRCRHSTLDFRKACRSRFHPYLRGIHRLLQNPRTCFEGPFGELLRATGPMAKANPFRFSSKYQDDETDLLYYGYRYYSASSGRWNSRDPIEERGGAHLYAFVGNDSISRIDAFGLDSTSTLPLFDYVPKCEIHIFVGHGFLDSAFDEDGGRKVLKNRRAPGELDIPYAIKSGECAGGTIIGCNTKWYTDVGKGIPGYEQPDGELRGMPLVDHLKDAEAKAFELGKAICINKNCVSCKKILIRVICGDMKHAVTPKDCGKTFKVDCDCYRK